LINRYSADGEIRREVATKYRLTGDYIAVAIGNTQSLSLKTRVAGQ